jgi:hypothetical protein
MREHELYARWLAVGTRIAFAVLVATFAVYMAGLLEPLVAPNELARLWVLPVDEFVAAAGAPSGWGWLGFLAKGDYLNLIGVAALASISVVCYARILPALPRLHAALAAIQIAVLLAAALA